MILTSRRVLSAVISVISAGRWTKGRASWSARLGKSIRAEAEQPCAVGSRLCRGLRARCECERPAAPGPELEQFPREESRRHQNNLARAFQQRERQRHLGADPEDHAQRDIPTLLHAERRRHGEIGAPKAEVEALEDQYLAQTQRRLHHPQPHPNL